jgi:hypothetical protein
MSSCPRATEIEIAPAAVSSETGLKQPSRLLSEFRELGVTFNPGAASVPPGEIFAHTRISG